MFNNINLTEKIIEIRKKQGISQQDVANYLGISRSAVATLENNKNNKSLTVDRVIKLSKLFGVNIFDLIKLDNTQEENIISKCKITKEINNLIDNIEKESEQYRAELQRLREVYIKKKQQKILKDYFRLFIM